MLQIKVGGALQGIKYVAVIISARHMVTLLASGRLRSFT